MIEEQITLINLNQGVVFSKHDLFVLLKEKGYSKTEGSFLIDFQKIINAGKVQRVGRNAYCVSKGGKIQYTYRYSTKAQDIAKCLQDNHPYADFVIFETIQLNEFINHQIGRNTFFVFIDNDVIDFAFDTLRNAYPSQVMVSPGIKEFHQYRNDNSIVLTRLISESPKAVNIKWHATLEKILVDIMADKLVKEIFSESENKAIYEDAFERYVVDESKMFRYARRRNAATKIKKFIMDNTSIQLKLEAKND